MKAREIMTRRVRTASPDMTVSEIARLLVRHNISAVPIADRRRRVVGIVSEGDLLRRQETGTTRRRARWLDFLFDTTSGAREFTKTRARRAADVMTRGVVSVTPDTDVGDIADLLEKRRIKRVPVMQGGRLVGIVSRQDVIASLAKPAPKSRRRAASDADIQAALARGMRAHSWTDRALVNFTVHRGVVELSGVVEDPDRRAALRVLAENTAGVRAVRDNLQVRPLQFYGAE
jgi:CBS domain-containing protein